MAIFAHFSNSDVEGCAGGLLPRAHEKTLSFLASSLRENRVWRHAPVAENYQAAP